MIKKTQIHLLPFITLILLELLLLLFPNITFNMLLTSAVSHIPTTVEQNIKKGFSLIIF